MVKRKLFSQKLGKLDPMRWSLSSQRDLVVEKLGLLDALREREREKKCFRQCKFQDTPRFELVIFGKFLLVNHAGKTWKECSNAALNDADQNFSGMSMISTWRQLHNRGMPQIFENVGSVEVGIHGQLLPDLPWNLDNEQRACWPNSPLYAESSQEIPRSTKKISGLGTLHLKHRWKAEM